MQNGAKIDASDHAILEMALKESTETGMVEYIMTRVV
jgi:hypothetical protein